MQLITLAEAKANMRVDHNYEDADITALISAASGAVLNYLKGSPIGQPLRDENGVPIIDTAGDVVYQRDTAGGLVIRPEIQQATKILVGELFKNREGKQDGAIFDKPNSGFGYGYLPQPVIYLLYPLRDPALA